ncbi:MAG TPA: DUF711 family protein [Anaerolineales bacterium]|nr:DUF711 family protein [Anaerolineales bacterium]
MKIRSITCFLDPGWPLNEEEIRHAGAFVRAARPAFEALGFEVQTTRLTTTPFPDLLDGRDLARAVDLAKTLSSAAMAEGFEYISIGPALPHIPESYEVIPEILAGTDGVFVSGVMADRDRGISLPAVRRCARVIHRIAPLEPNGFANLYFAAMANVPPLTPFYPASYHNGGKPAFALAIESANLAVDTFDGETSLTAASQRLAGAISSRGETLARLSRELEARFSLAFAGIDFSLAPFPEELKSIGTAIERMGLPAAGGQGTLAAASLLASALDRADFPRTGFNGLFFPVLEDSVLAQRSAEGRLGVNDLLLFSAVCGSGLDIVPLPGETTAEEIEPLLLDLSALALRLNKPLGARLMPIPGKVAGDPTDFNFPYFANGRVLSLRSEPLRGPFTGEDELKISPRGA